MSNLPKDIEEFINNMPEEEFIKLVEQTENFPFTIVLPKLRVKRKRKKWLKKRL